MVPYAGIDHVSFTVTDLDVSQRFYADVLGLAAASREELMEWERETSPPRTSPASFPRTSTRTSRRGPDQRKGPSSA